MGKVRDATGSVGSGCLGGGCTSAGHSLCWGPFPSTKECQRLLELLFDSDSSQARLGTNHPAPGGRIAASSPHPPMPTHLSLPDPATAQAVPATHRKALRRKSYWSVILYNPYPKYSLLAAWKYCTHAKEETGRGTFLLGNSPVF